MTYPFYVYLTNVPWPKDPLEDQIRWLEEERGGTVSQEVREKFRSLQKAAHFNNISFQDLYVLHDIASAKKLSFPDLCTWALGTPFKETWKPEELATNRSKFSEKLKSLERIRAIADENKVDFRDLCTYALTVTFKESRVDVDELAKDKKKLQTEVAALTLRGKNEPANAELQLALAQSLEGLGDVHDRLHESTDAIKSLEQSRRIYELLFWKPTDSPAVLEGLANVCSKLGDLSSASDRASSKAESYGLYQRSVAALDRLCSRPNANPEWIRDKARVLRQLGSLCSRVFSPTEGVRWWSQAIDQRDEQAGCELATLFREHPELPKAFPATTQNLLKLLGGKAKKDLITLPNPAHVEALLQFADWYDKGTNVEPDHTKADHCRYLAHYARGWRRSTRDVTTTPCPICRRSAN